MNALEPCGIYYLRVDDGVSIKWRKVFCYVEIMTVDLIEEMPEGYEPPEGKILGEGEKFNNNDWQSQIPEEYKNFFPLS